MNTVPGNQFGIDIGRYRMAYCRFFLPPKGQGWDDYVRALDEVAQLATSFGGSVSSCTGVGLKHRDHLVYEFSDVALRTMWKIKNTLDPDGVMNPGKKLPTSKD
jgi:FAD/FMN-containing dehydrogenase